MTIALFPGQGVQKPGMGMTVARHPAALEAFATASDVLAIDMIALCRDGVAMGANLQVTRWAQPAVLTCSVAAFRSFDYDDGFTAVAGHSVGEYAALVCAGALDFSDALRLVTLRAEVTDQVARTNPGAMAAVMHVERDVVEKAISGTDASLAADNSARQVVISGPLQAIDQACRLLKEAGALTRALNVSGAFHSPMMSSAAAPLEHGLDAIDFARPRLEVWSPTRAAALRSPAEMRRALIDQLTAPVRWRETIEAIAGMHPGEFIDVGPGKVVGALAKRIVPEARVRAIDALVPSGDAA